MDLEKIFVDMMSYAHESLFYVQDPSKRIYWGFLISSAVFGLIFSVIYRKQHGVKQAFIDLINPKALFSRTTLEDISLLVINNVLRFMLFLPILFTQTAIALYISRFLNQNVMDTPQIVLSVQLVSVLYTIAYFVVDDFSRFFLHMISHKYKYLWRFHELHHSCTTLTPLTVYRLHPVESFFYSGRSILAVGLVSGVFMYLFAGHISGWDILGISALGFVFNALGSNLRHSHIPLSFGKLEKWFISPAQHQIHHSKEHINTNFGSCLAIWDRMFGTWIAGSPDQNLEFGLASNETIKAYYKKQNQKKKSKKK